MLELQCWNFSFSIHSIKLSKFEYSFQNLLWLQTKQMSISASNTLKFRVIKAEDSRSRIIIWRQKASQKLLRNKCQITSRFSNTFSSFHSKSYVPDHFCKIHMPILGYKSRKCTIWWALRNTCYSKDCRWLTLHL